MPSIPLSFLLVLLLLILALIHLRRSPHPEYSLLGLISLCALSLSLTGLRWGYGLSDVRVIQPIASSVLPPVLWYVFLRLTGLPGRNIRETAMIALLTTLFVALPWLNAWIDPLLSLIYMYYSCRFLLLYRKSPDEFTHTRFSQINQVRSLAVTGGITLFLCMLADLSVQLDFIWSGGQHAATLITAAQSVLLFMLIYLCLHTASSRGEITVARQTPYSETETGDNTQALVIKLETQLTEKEWFNNPDLTLDLLARKSGVPGRQISAAVNRFRQQNISQWINTFRIRKAQELLQDTELTVTEIYLATGFNTKSNFNREFRRICDCSPTQFRTGQRP